MLHLPLDSEPLPLLPEGPPQVPQLVLHEAVDPVARRADGLADVVLDAVNGNALEQFAALLARPERSLRAGTKRRPAGDPSAAEERRERAPPRGPTTKQ